MIETGRSADILIIGGGIQGCATALHLVRRGASVILLEKDHIGRHASGVNAGGVRRLGRAFAEVALSQAASDYWQDIRALVDDDCGYRQSRQLKIALDEAGMEEAETRVKDLRALGFNHEEMVDRDQLRQLLPAASDRCLGALLVEGDGAALPYRTTLAFRRRAEALGARILENCPVLEVDRVGDIWRAHTARGWFEAPVIVNAAGAWGGDLAARLGDRIPLTPCAPMLAITARLPAITDAVVGAIGAPLSFKQLECGTVLIGGGAMGRAIPEENRTELDFPALAPCLSAARTIFPVMGAARLVRAWAGIEGWTPDGVPVIGRGQAEGVIHAFGFSGHGFQLGPAVGAVVAGLALGEQTGIAIDGLTPDRFQSPDWFQSLN